MLFSKYSKFVILTNYINQKIKPNKNVFQNHYYTCNYLKKHFKPYGIDEKKKKKPLFKKKSNLLLISLMNFSSS